MKSLGIHPGTIAVPVLLVICAVAISGCAIFQDPGYDNYYIVVYFDEDGFLYPQPSETKPIETLMVFRGDQVVWINPTKKEVSVVFADASWFGQEELKVPANQRAVLRVEKGALGGGACQIIIDDIIKGTPTVKVSDGP